MTIFYFVFILFFLFSFSYPFSNGLKFTNTCRAKFDIKKKSTISPKNFEHSFSGGQSSLLFHWDSSQLFQLFIDCIRKRQGLTAPDVSGVQASTYRPPTTLLNFSFIFQDGEIIPTYQFGNGDIPTYLIGTSARK